VCPLCAKGLFIYIRKKKQKKKLGTDSITIPEGGEITATTTDHNKKAAASRD